MRAAQLSQVPRTDGGLSAARHSAGRTVARPWAALTIAFIAFFLACSAWSLATPISGGPDESGHIMKAAASARGMWTGTATVNPGIEQFVLPANVSDVGGERTCFAFNAERSAACAPSLSDAPAADVVVETGVGSYNPLYYVLVGWPSLFLSGEIAVYGMRIASSVLTALFLTGTLWAVRRISAAPYAAGGLLVAFTPMVYFLGGVINPNGVEAAGTAAFVACLWLALSSRRAPLAAIAGVAASAALVANLRATSPLYLALAAIAVITAVGWPHAVAFIRRRAVIVMAVPALAVAGLGAFWTLGIGLNAGFIPSSGAERDDPATAFLTTLGNSLDYARQFIATFGWLDTQVPGWIHAVWLLLIGVTIAGALLVVRGRRMAAVLISLATLVLLPAIIQAPTAADYGYIWQGRYSLPLFATLIIVATLATATTVRRTPHRLGLWALVAGTVALTVAHIAAFLYVLRRYVVGVDGSFLNALVTPEWYPPLGWLPSVVLCLLGALGVALAVMAPTVTQLFEGQSVPRHASRRQGARSTEAPTATPERTP
ncbi:DUF2142 domain-containing protein [Marisediminicola senii]|uniref:DUF2142 domain-containing protein n=1 Tax=Marisediminicola senii TaxID=2711233 RepID=UPI0013E9C212|nr:DUF2142 domain-containing protein [Marisediminicola senii]